MSVVWKNKQSKPYLGRLKRIKLQGTPAMQTTIRSRQVSCEQVKEKRKLLRGEPKIYWGQISPAVLSPSIKGGLMRKTMIRMLI